MLLEWAEGVKGAKVQVPGRDVGTAPAASDTPQVCKLPTE